MRKDISPFLTKENFVRLVCYWLEKQRLKRGVEGKVKAEYIYIYTYIFSCHIYIYIHSFYV